MKKILTITGDMGSYGYGMIQFNRYNNGPIYGLGHTGSAFGYGSMLCYVPSLNVYMCSAGNYMKISQEFLQRDIFNFLASGPTSVAGVAARPSFSLYPNPATRILNISTPLRDYRVSVLDMTGRELWQAQNACTIDLAPYPPGTYLLKLQDGQTATSEVRKFRRE